METILLVENIARHANMIRSYLEKQEYHVTVCPSLQEAKEQLAKQPPNFLVIDLNVGVDGFFEFYGEITEKPGTAEIPRLFIAGKLQADLAKQLETEYKETILNKPLEMNRFMTTIDRLKSARGKSPIITKYRGQDYFSTFIGKQIGSATIKREIGRGGMGAVFLGHQESLDREVAVKLLLPEWVGDEAAIERFQREALAIAKLKSPHIVQIFDFGEFDNNALYIIMEYLAGQTVEQYLKRSGSFPIEKAITVIAQVAAGIQVAHDAGLIHRDIKPSNLVLNNKGHVTITDFGLVRPQKKLKQAAGGMLIGTPHYMSPEVASDTPMDARSDIYSLGMVFYHLLAGHPPFLSGDPMEILMKHLNEPLPDIRKAIPNFPQDVYNILERMTAKDPAERYINCRELLWDLKAQERKYIHKPAASSPPEAGEESPLEKAAKIKVDTSVYPGLSKLRHQFPAIFSPDNLLGTMTIDETGSTVDSKGKFPEEWRNALFILHESTKQLEEIIRLGKWKFKLIETPEEIVAVFPQGNNLGTMIYNQRDTGSFSGAALEGVSGNFSSAKQAKDPIRQIASIVGVIDVLLFNTEGRLADYSLRDEQKRNEYSRRLPPVSQIIQSLAFNIASLDLWYEKGRVLLWRLEAGIIFIIATVDISRSFLSINIIANLERLNANAARQAETAEEVKKKKEAPQQAKPPVVDPVPARVLENLQTQLARRIGPIAPLVISRACRRLGYSKDNFPTEQLPALGQQLTPLVEESQQEKFNREIRDIIPAVSKRV